MDVEENLQQELAQAAEIYNMLVQFFVNYSFQIIGAILILLIGLFVAKKIGNSVLKLCEKKDLDVTLSRFIASVVRLAVMAMVVIIVLGKLGISVTPLVAAIGALSLGAGLAVQGLLSNYSAGLNIILTRPFVVGDTISVQGVTGQVKEVTFSATVITNEDDVQITIPNRHIVGEIIHNSFSSTLAELVVKIDYSEDVERVIHVLEHELNKIDVCSEQKAPKVGVEAFADSGVVIGIRLWLATQNYHELRFRINQVIYTTLRQHNIKIALPQQAVRIISQQESAPY